MPRAELAITVPESVWVGDLSRRHPEATFRVLSVFPQPDSGVALAEVTAPDVAEVVTELSEYDDVTETEVLQHRDDTVLVQFETREPVLLVPVRNARTPLELPFSVADGTVSWEVTASSDRLSSLGDQLRELGIEFDVRSVQEVMEAEGMLTPTQHQLVETAVEEGYYETPRRCTLTDLAETADIAKSTCSETLHRAEGKIVTEFVDEHRGTRLVPAPQ